MSQNYSYPSSSSITLSAEGPNGLPIPTESILIAGESPGGNLQPLQTDASGNLKVNIAAGTLTVLNPSVSATGAAVPPDATYAGMNVAGNLTGLTGTVNGLKVDGSAVTQPTNLTEVGGVAIALGQTTMSASLPVAIASNQSAITVVQATGSNLHVDVDNFPAVQDTLIPDVVTTGNITSTQSVMAVNNGLSTAGITITGTWTGSITLEGSIDGTNYFAISGGVFTGGLISSNFAANNSFQTNISGLSNVRMRGNTVTSGTAVITIRLNATTGAVVLTESLPQGGNTIGMVGIIGSGNVASVTASNALKVDGSGATQGVNLTEVGGSAIALGQTTMSASLPVTIASDQSSLMVIDGPDVTEATQNLTTIDMVSTSTTGFYNQTIITGTPTAGSAAVYSIPNVAALQCQISGTWTGTIQFERSMDGGTTWNLTSGLVLGVGLGSSFVTSNATLLFGIQGCSHFRTRMVAPSTGTAVILVRQSYTEAATVVANALKIVDGTANSSNLLTIKAASTAPLATDPAVVVTMSPNSPAEKALAGRSFANAPFINQYASTNVTTGAYVQMIASTTSAANLVEIFDSSGQAIYFAVGGSGSEVNQFIIYPGGNGQVPLSIPAGSRISLKAVTATASSGYITLNLYT